MGKFRDFFTKLAKLVKPDDVEAQDRARET